MIAALYVEEGGVYCGLEDVDPWPKSRDARKYAGPWSVVAHPECKRWGRYWGGGPSAKVKQKKGDDGGQFKAASEAVCWYGGVLEHPADTAAWAHCGIPKPPPSGWLLFDQSVRGMGMWTCRVEQGHYGHRARKATWLLYVGFKLPPILKWGPSTGERLDEGFHSKVERDAARAAGIKPRKRLSSRENMRTPIPFRDLLISMARDAAWVEVPAIARAV